MSADIGLDDINVDLALEDFKIDLGGGVDFGLGSIAAALGHINADIGLGRIDAKADAKVDAGLDDIRINHLPVVQVEASIKSIPVIRTESMVDLGLDDIRIRELAPIKLEFSFNPIRIHLPLNYSFCIELFGVRLFKFSLCGEGMVVTEDYKPRETERCR